MKKPVLIILILVSCSEKGSIPVNQVESDLLIYVTENLKIMDSTLRVDSVRFIRMDSITEKHRLLMKAAILENEFYEMKADFEQEQERAETNIQIARLSNGISKELFENYKAESEKSAAKLKDIAMNMKVKGAIADSLREVLADSIKAIALQPVYIYQYTRPDRTIKRDTGYAFMTLDFKLIKQEDFLQK